MLGEIRAILADPALAGRSIGVVTLLGQDQAPFIHSLIQRHIEPRDIIERRLRVGSPAVFQGDERDIMLVSMVLAKGERGVPSRIDFEQRFNVAASRARDRMILFRSIEEGDVAIEGLNGLLMAHFRSPFRGDAIPAASLRDSARSASRWRAWPVCCSLPCPAWRTCGLRPGSRPRKNPSDRKNQTGFQLVARARFELTTFGL